MECKNCGCEEFYTEQHGPHMGLYCKACKQWVKWEKQNNSTKTADEYKAEYFEGQEATPKQLSYLRTLGYSGKVRSKQHAMQLISVIKGDKASGT